MQAEDTRAVARAVAALAGGPDALRAMVGPDDAVRVMHAAGQDRAPAVREWRDVKAARQREADESRAAAEALWSGDPTHHPRYLEALRAGASMTELGILARQVGAEIERTRPRTAAERYAEMRREYDRSAAASAQRSMPAPGEPGEPQRPQDQDPPAWRAARPASAMPGI